jgi:hypothetical protein
MPPRDELSTAIGGARIAKIIYDPNNNTKYLFGNVLGLYENLTESTTKFSVSFDDGSRDIVNLEELSGKVHCKIYL